MRLERRGIDRRPMTTSSVHVYSAFTRAFCGRMCVRVCQRKTGIVSVTTERQSGHRGVAPSIARHSALPQMLR